jgi:hypothetical protein
MGNHPIPLSTNIHSIINPKVDFEDTQRREKSFARGISNMSQND